MKYISSTNFESILVRRSNNTMTVVNVCPNFHLNKTCENFPDILCISIYTILVGLFSHDSP